MANSVKVKYFDPSGTPKDGYIIDNLTYKDPDGNERVELGSVVETAGGSYTLTKNGGVKTNILDNYHNKAQGSILSSKKDAALAIRSNYEGRKAEIENYKKDAIKNYNKTVAKQNQQKLQNEKNMAQKLKAQGITGGLSESMLIANDILYEENINELGRQLNKTLADYDNLLIKLASDTEYEIFQSNSEYDAIYADFLMESAKVKNDDLNSEKQLNSENYRFNKNFQRDVYESDREYERSVYEDERDADFKEREYQRAVYEDERDYDWKVYDDNRDYDLSLYKANNTSSSSGKSDKEYERKLAAAKELAKIGDYSALAEFYGWTDEQLKQAEIEYYVR